MLGLNDRAFHRVTAGRYKKPFNAVFRDLMVTTARYLVARLQTNYAHTISDEISGNFCLV